MERNVDKRSAIHRTAIGGTRCAFPRYKGHPIIQSLKAKG
jgi:hypothetical protein